MTPEEMAREVSPVRARIGAAVTQRLQAAGAQIAPSEHFSLWYVQDFLDADDCAFLIAEIERDRQPSTLLSDDPEQDFRTSDSCNLLRWDERVRSIDRRICTLMGLEERQGETLQGQRYAPGQYFRTHHDFFHTDQAYFAKEQACGGQRTWTAMIFLNEPEAGGQTNFPKANIRITPKRGNLLTWNNLDKYGDPNIFSLHQGMPVDAGVKYVITKWYRERPWGQPPA
jgi:prolyl 4-hydroxylase